LTVPRLSVVMSVFNGEKFLQESIESVLRQTYKDFEFIIINDGSLDASREIIESYRDSRIVFIQQKNMGLTKSLNRGIAIARGEFIARQDADDISIIDRFEKQVRFLEENPAYALVGTWADIIDDAGVVSGSIEHEKGHYNIVARLAFANQFVHGSTMFRSSHVKAACGYDEKMILAQDYDLWVRLCLKHRAANLPDHLYRWRQNRGGLSVTRGRLQRRSTWAVRAKYFTIVLNADSLPIFAKLRLLISLPYVYITYYFYHDLTSCRAVRKIKKLAYRKRTNSVASKMMILVSLPFISLSRLTKKHGVGRNGN
jgi:glycosyltransferase involved in cell wall biosynthesis